MKKHFWNTQKRPDEDPPEEDEDAPQPTHPLGDDD